MKNCLNGLGWLPRMLPFFFGVIGCFCFCYPKLNADELSFGPLIHRFPLTLAPGVREEIAGPLFYQQQSGSQTQWALPPLLSYTYDRELDYTEIDFAYPVVSYDRFGPEYRLQFLQLFSFAGGANQNATDTDRITLFPLFFYQRSTDTNQNYTALVPFYGHLKKRLMRDEIQFVMFPAYAYSRKQDVETYNYLFPVFHLRYGNGLRGWQFWPLIGHETKTLTTKTNLLGDIETVGGHRKFFALWPLIFDQHTEIGTTNEQTFKAFLPLFSQQRSPQRDSSTYLWPLFTYTDDRARKYREWDMPWPLVVFARGEGKTTSRIWPLFSQASNSNLVSNFYLWPLYKYNAFHGTQLERERTRILLFLYSDLTEKAPGDTNAFRRTDLWPLFTARRERNGNERLQLFAPLEPLVPNNKSIERNYSPLWSIWRSERNAATGATSQSFLWNLYRRDATPQTKKISLLFGLFRYQSGPDGKHWRLFYVPLGKKTKPPPATQNVSGNVGQASSLSKVEQASSLPGGRRPLELADRMSAPHSRYALNPKAKRQ